MPICAAAARKSLKKKKLMLTSRLKKFPAGIKGPLFVGVLIFALDRISKILALKFLAPAGSLDVFPFFRLTYVENTGAAFGSFKNGNLYLALISALVLFIMFKWKAELDRLGAAARWGFVFITAGALGNIYDRLALGFVVDYFDFIVWPVFNVADSFICIGAGLIALAAVKDEIKKKSEAK